MDDDSALVDVIGYYLKDSGYRYLACSTVAEAGFKQRNELFACIILDFNLSQETCERLIDMIRIRFGQNEFTPIIILSGSLSSEAVELIRLKVNSVLVKPVKKEVLNLKVSELIKQYEQAFPAKKSLYQ